MSNLKQRRTSMKSTNASSKVAENEASDATTTWRTALSNFVGARSEEHAVVLAFVHLNVVAYAFSYWLCQPILPFLAKELGVTDIGFGWLSTVFSAVQLLGGPVIGRICDTAGPRLALQISQAGTGLSYLFLGAATTVKMLFLSRLPTVFMHAMHASQAFASAFSSSTSRATALGRLSLAYGVGMVAGASLGGKLSDYIGYSNVAFVAAAISFTFLFFNMFILPATTPQEVLAASKVEDSEKSTSKSASGSSGVGAVLQLLRIPSVLTLLIFQVTLGIALSMYHTSFNISSPQFGFDAKMLGYYQSAGAILGVIANTFIVGNLTERFGEKALLTSCSLVLSICFLVFAFFITEGWQLFVLLVPFGFSTSILYTVATSALSKASSVSNAGTAIGLGHSARSLCGIIGPAMSGYVTSYGLSTLGITAHVFALIATLAVRIMPTGEK